ncbi:MAG: MupA/Atu3671 family FMN-dependent luciferase-like monooxygenase [Burkholderiaceae bacterium]
MVGALEAEYPLSPIQQGLLFHHLLGAVPGVDLEQIVCSLHEELDLPAFQRAWQAVLGRHAVLRTSFRWEDVEEPLQQVHYDAALSVEELDWRDVPPAALPDRLEAYLRSDRARGFDLRQPPRRLAILRTGERDHEVVWSFHHILLDGRSFPIVLGDVFAVYEAYRRERTPRLPAARPYRDHVAWLRQQDLTLAEPFWRERLAGFTAATPLPGAAPGSASASERRHCSARLSPALTSALAGLADRLGLHLNTIVQGAFALLLSRHSGETDIVFGAIRAGRGTSVEGARSMVGTFINTLPVRVRIPAELCVSDWLGELHAMERAVRSFEHTPLVDVQRWSAVAPGQPLFESLVVFDDAGLDSKLRALGGAFAQRSFRLHERTNYPLTLYAYGEPELQLEIAYDHPRMDDATAQRLLGHLGALLEGIAADPQRSTAQVSLLTAPERAQLVEQWNATARDVPEAACIHHLIRDQAARTPDAVALVCGDAALSYRELDARSDRLARHLQGLGVGVETLVGICLERSLDLVVAVLAVLKAGGAYLPLDPEYPAARLRFMVEDAALEVLLTTSLLAPRLKSTPRRIVELDTDAAVIALASETRLDSAVQPHNLAYVIYTSGSTGAPKGVMVEHRNVVNFFAGMDERIPHDPPGTWLAVTSLSFDISVVELLWTLTHGFRVVVHAGESRAAPALMGPDATRLDFSLFYFASDEETESDKYRLLLDGARFADANGFAAVWTPERHFHAFGGLYPNPAVTGAALAALTQHVRIRAGSVVLPLHHPARVAEEWAVVDNLSRGRVDVSFASGWQPNDFVLRPDAYAQARELLFRDLETVRRLWRGEAVSFPGPRGAVQVRTLPRPVQPELPVWITSAGNVETYRRAGEVGANVLTHLLGQTLPEVAERIRIYREARREHGHSGPGCVTLMLHAFLGEDVEAVRATVREPMLRYLRSSLSLIRSFAGAWTAFKKRADGSTAQADVDVSALSESELNDLLSYSFERYFETSALFGTPEACLEFVKRLEAIGVNEVACLIDFGVAAQTVLAHLPQLARLRELSSVQAAPAPAQLSLADALRRHGVTHMQCTPSLACVLLLDEEGRASVRDLDVLMLGGEALPGALAAQLGALTPARILNLYGPTETTVWSSTHTFSGEGNVVPIGRPIANTELYILDSQLRPVPVGVAGELYIGGAGVARGYLGRPDLSAERFIAHPFFCTAGARLYRTGDRARYRSDGVVEFLGRVDRQIKLRGHRIEPGEIEAVLAGHAAVAEAAVVAREDAPGDVRLVAYVVPRVGAAPVAAELRSWLRERLPEPLLPSHFVQLDALPLTPNRKLDRRALPPPEAQEPVEPAASAAPAGDLERAIAEVWRDVLKVSRVGLDDNFFDLGGHSLLAVRVHRRLRQLASRELAITDLFRFPTVRALATFLTGRSGGPSLDASRERGAQRREALARRRIGRRRGDSAEPGEPA